MKVKELVEKLSKFDENLEMVFVLGLERDNGVSSTGWGEVVGISEVEGEVVMSLDGEDEG